MSNIQSKNAGRFTNLFRNPFKPMNLTITGGLLAGVVSGVFFFSGWFVPAIIMFILILIIENLRKPIGNGRGGHPDSAGAPRTQGYPGDHAVFPFGSQPHEECGEGA
jgi:hypothetical protein